MKIDPENRPKDPLFPPAQGDDWLQSEGKRAKKKTQTPYLERRLVPIEG